MTDRQLIVVAAITLLIGVGAGAFGAHGLKRMISPDMLGVWQTAVLYQLVHGLGMLLIAVLSARFGSALLGLAGSVMFLGVLFFRGRSEEHTSELQSLMRISDAALFLE